MIQSINDSHRGGLLRAKCRAYALPEVPASAPLHRLWCDRNWLQDCDRRSSETIRHVLDRRRGYRNLPPFPSKMLPCIQGADLQILVASMTRNRFFNHLAPVAFIALPLIFGGGQAQ